MVFPFLRRYTKTYFEFERNATSFFLFCAVYAINRYRTETNEYIHRKSEYVSRDWMSSIQHLCSPVQQSMRPITMGIKYFGNMSVFTLRRSLCCILILQFWFYVCLGIRIPLSILAASSVPFDITWMMFEIQTRLFDWEAMRNRQTCRQNKQIFTTQWTLFDDGDSVISASSVNKTK